MSGQPPHSGLFVLFLLFSSPVLSNAKAIEWTFTADGASHQLLKLSVGTPPQPLTVGLADFGECENLQVSGDVFTTGGSITFVQTGVYEQDEERVGVFGQDDVQVGDDGVAFRTKPFILFDPGVWIDETDGRISWNRLDNASASFIQSVLKELDEQIVVFSFDQVTHSIDVFGSGVITLGARPTARCAPEWKYVPESPFLQPYDQWSTAVDEASFGAYTFDAPGYAHFSLFNTQTAVPKAIFDAFLQFLGAPDEFNVPCDATGDFVLTLGDVEIRLTPADYLDRSQEKSQDRCWVYMDYNDEGTDFFLPSTIWNKHCLLLDYAHLQLGFADRVH
ncbi:hypothetical protein M3Y99_01305500 [Aphelenchoides fujianensis]|nr:hypothetical protein M3Y99_01305500 [Aphelenchoides fujianensis]